MRNRPNELSRGIIGAALDPLRSLLAPLPAQRDPADPALGDANGARVYFVENHDLPMLDVSVDFPAGAAATRARNPALASLTRGLLRAGRGGHGRGRDRAPFRRRRRAAFGGRFDADRAGLSLRTLSSAEERDQALDVLARILQQPTFPQAVLEREKVRVMAGLREADTKPETIAARRSAAWSTATIPTACAARAKSRRWRSSRARIWSSSTGGYYVAEHAVVAIIGDVTRDEARERSPSS